MKTVLLVNRAGMGHGDDGLAVRILHTLLSKSGAFRELEAVVFYNSGVKLLAEGSEVLQPLASLEDRGVEVIGCATCVDHFGVRDRIRVGEIGSMDQIISLLSQTAKVITL